MSPTNESKQGVIYATLAFMMWGLAPMYFKLIAQLPALEILMHRAVWSFILMLVVIVAINKWSALQQVLKSPKLLLIMLGAATLLCCNWGIFIWAVTNDHILDASLGYYINPLLNVLLGVVVLGERLKRLQGVAVALAATGVLIQVLTYGSFPYIAMGLAFSFAIYGLIRKQVPVDSLTGMFIESGFMLPVALLYWLIFANSDMVNMVDNGWQLNLLIMGVGLVTTLPLLCFTAGARRIRLATLGFLQYIGPSFMFVLAISIYDEQVGADRWLTFGFIWTALVIYTWDTIRVAKPQQATA